VSSIHPSLPRQSSVYLPDVARALFSGPGLHIGHIADALNEWLGLERPHGGAVVLSGEGAKVTILDTVRTPRCVGPAALNCCFLPHLDLISYAAREHWVQEWAEDGKNGRVVLSPGGGGEYAHMTPPPPPCMVRPLLGP
jgi:hypothetical protein